MSASIPTFDVPPASDPTAPWSLADPFREEGWTSAFRDLLAQRTNSPSFERLKDDLKAMQAEVKEAAAAWYETARRL